jgi:hypothetical protein
MPLHSAGLNDPTISVAYPWYEPFKKNHFYLAQSRCLDHNAHVGKILSFCKILDLKITHL